VCLLALLALGGGIAGCSRSAEVPDAAEEAEPAREPEETAPAVVSPEPSPPAPANVGQDVSIKPEDLSKPLDVESYYGRYDTSQKDMGRASRSLEGPVAEKWPSPPKPKRPYFIGVLFPHLKDPYWLAVDYGIIQRARTIGVSIKLLEAGGYRRLGDQRKHLTQVLVDAKVDGIILASISYDKLDKAVEEVIGRGVPIVEVINDIFAPKISAKALVSFHDMGYRAGEFVLQDARGRDVKIAFLPGPEDSGWAPDTYVGFQKALADNTAGLPKGKVTILPPEYGDTGTKIQSRVLDFVLKRNEGIDYIVCNAVAAAAAANVLKQYKDKHPNAKTVGTYIIPEVYEQIRTGSIAAAPTDLTVDQGRMAVDMIVRILNGDEPGSKTQQLPFRSGPVIQIVTHQNVDQFPYERLFGERGFKAIFDFRPKP